MGKKIMRNFPKHTLEEALAVPQKIQDERAGRPFNRLLLADALAIKPSSTNFRDLLSASYKYGLTEGTKRATDISLTPTGADGTQRKDSSKRLVALRKAALTPTVFMDFFESYKDHKLPSAEMMTKLLVSEYNVPSQYAGECARLINENGRFVDIVRDIGGSAHVLIVDETPTTQLDEQMGPEGEPETAIDRELESPEPPTPEALDAQKPSLAIFVGHGKKRAPLEKLQKFLTSFQIPYKVVVDEASLGRPISQKVKDTMAQCGSAILIFTCDEKFLDVNGNEVWRPSENVVYELGAASYAYEDRVVIFKEKGINFPTNFESIGYIEFEEDSMEAKTTDLLKELIGFGLVKFTTA